MAMLLRSLRARVISRGARNFRAYADLAVAYEERDWESNGTRNRVIRMPSGPAVVITPWNAPFMLSTWKTAPALAAGLHGDPEAGGVVAALVLAPLRPRRRGRFPAGRLQRRPGDRRGGRGGARRAIRASAGSRSPGSPETAVHIGTAAAKNIVPFTGELGGKGPAAGVRGRRSRGRGAEGGRPVRRRRPGVPRRHAAPRRASRSRRSSSSSSTASRTSTCSATRATTRPPSRRSSTPTTWRASRGSSSGRARTATRSSAAADRRDDVGPLFYDPTLVVPRSNDSEIVQREVFGPVLTFQTFADEEEGDRARELDALRPLGDRLHGLRRAGRTGGARGARRHASGSTPFSSAT